MRWRRVRSRDDSHVGFAAGTQTDEPANIVPAIAADLANGYTELEISERRG